jgi:hypothetical protein
MVAAAEIEYQHVAELRLAVDRLAELPPGQRVEKLVDVLRSEHRPYAVDRHAIADGQAAPSDPVVVILGAIGRHVGKQLAGLFAHPRMTGLSLSACVPVICRIVASHGGG